MDIASLIGLILAFGLILASIVIGGGSFASFIDVPSGMVVIGGAMAAVMMSFPLKILLTMPKVMIKCFLNKPPAVDQIIATMVSLADTARREGLLALEARMEEIDDKFVKLGLQMAVDGTRPEIVEEVLRNEVHAVATRHKAGKAMFDGMGRFAPAYGMIGTLMGLIMMLSDMSDPSQIGKGMAVALITTLYGAIISNCVFLPLAEKLALLSKQELIAMEVAIKGIQGLQSGDNPRVIEQKLLTFLTPAQRAAREKAA